MLNRIGTVLCAGALAACAAPQKPTYTLRGESPAAGADADIYVDKKKPNFHVRVDMHHLLPPNRVGSGAAQYYAVWIKPRSEEPIHAANLRYDKKKREGEALLVTPYREFDLRITAEASPLPDKPSDHELLSQQIVVPQH